MGSLFGLPLLIDDKKYYTRSKKFMKKNIITVLIAIAILVVILPTVISSAYSVYVADDFSAGGMIKDGYTGLKYVKYYYNNWQGTYTGMFLVAWLSPIVHGGLQELRILSILVSILTYFSFGFLINAVANHMLKIKSFAVRLSIVFLSIYMLSAFMCYNEIFYWFTGMAVYTIPMIALMLGLGLYIDDKGNKSIPKLVIISILGIVSGGGALAIPGFGCYFLLVLIFFDFIKAKKINIPNVIVFAIWVISALINTAAPGNFARHDVVDSTGVHPLHAISDSVKICLDRVVWFNENTAWIAVLLVVFVVSFIVRHESDENPKCHILLVVMLLFLPFITIFPVALGQGMRTPNRVLFSLDIAIFVVAIYLFAVFGIIAANLLAGEDVKKALVVFTLLLTLVCVTNDSFSYEDQVFYKVSSQLSAKEYQNYYITMVGIYDKLESEPTGADVAIYRHELPADIENFNNFYLDLDPADWVNTDISDYFDFNSLTLIEE